MRIVLYLQILMACGVFLSLLERFTYQKLACLLVLIVGTAIVSFGDGGDSDDDAKTKSTEFGDVICLVSAVLYGMYTTAIRKFIPTDGCCDMSLFFGFLGLFSLFFGFPGLYYCDHSLGPEVIACIVLKGVLQNVIADYLWARAMILTSPTVATIALSMTIPMAIVTDTLMGTHYPTTTSLAGASLVILGFLRYSQQE